MKIEGSSNIASVDHIGTTLTVEFHSGVIWDYFNVPAEVYTDMLKAPSVGKYFNAVVKGKFDGKKREDQPK